MASVDSSDIPAGFFSTFSIADPYNPAPGHVVKAQKRNRRVFVCIPCHRRKLKCDKLLPCSRCVAAEIADECSYMPPPAPAAGRSKKGRDRKTAGRGSKSVKDEAKSTKSSNPKVKRESSLAPSLSSLSSHSSSLSPCPSTSPSRSPSPAPPTKSAQKPAPKPRQATTTSSDPPSSQVTLCPESDDDECELPDFDDDDSKSTRPLNGASHWTRIASEFPEARPYFFGTDLQWQQRYRQVKSLQCLFPSLDDNINFPFSNTNPASKSQILSSLPPNHIVDTLVGNYLDTFGATHCLFHPGQLRFQVQQFYDAPSGISDEWLAQLCMILALGAESSSDFLFSGSGQSAAEWASIFLNAAQASFGRSSYMVAPTLCTVRTLCMMVLAKLIEAPASGGSCSDNNGSSGCNSAPGDSSSDTFHSNGYTSLMSLMAFTMSTATCLQLHRSIKTSEAPHDVQSTGKKALNSVEAEMRRRIWVTIQLLDITTALRAGTATIQKPGGHDVEPPQPFPSTGFTGGSNTVYDAPKSAHNGMNGATGFHIGGFPLNDYGFKATHTTASGGLHDLCGDVDGLYQNKVASLLPTLVDMVNAANSPANPRPRPSQVKVWDTRARKLLGQIKSALLPGQHPSNGGMETDRKVGWQQQGFAQHLGAGMFDPTATVNQVQRASVQYQCLEALVHRALLALHHDSFCASLSPTPKEGHGRSSPETSSLYAMSQAAVVRSSLALLNTHKTWAAAVMEPADRCPSTCTNMTTTGSATATAASVDSPFSSMLQLPVSGGGPILGVIKSTAAEMILQQQHQQMQPLPLSLSGRSSPTMFGCGSDVPTIATGLPIPSAPATSTPMVHNTGWLLDLCHDDFGAALQYMVLALRAVHCQGQAILGCPQDEDAAVTAIRYSYQVMRDRSYRSVAHFKEFLGVAVLFACFRGLRSGGDMLSQVVDATNDVEQVVVAGRRYLLWAADSFTTPDETAALMGFNGPLMAYGSL